MAQSASLRISLMVVLAVVISSILDAADGPPSAREQKPAASLAKVGSLLRSDNEEHQHAALDRLAELRLDEQELRTLLSDALQKAKKSGRMTVAVARMIRTLAALDDPDAVEELLRLLAVDDSRFVMLAADSLSEHQRQSALSPLIQLRQRLEFETSYGFRHCTVNAVAQYEEPQSVDFLVGLVPELDGQLKYVTAMHLSRLTGQQFGGDADAWKRWWTESRDGFDFQQAHLAVKPAIAVPIPWNHPVPTFYGVPIYAKRIVFLVDRSRSMLSSVGGQTRMERAQDELSQTFRALPEDALFNVIAFDRAALSWKPQLVPATSANKREAVSAIRRLIPGEKTAAYEALETGFSFDPNTELIVFLSDGRPTAGEIIAPDEIVETISWMNLFRRTTIDSLALDTQDQSEKFMQDLAVRNFGQFFRVR